MSLRSLYQLPVYYLTLVLFGLGGLEVSLLGLMCSGLPGSDRLERGFQRWIHLHFAVFHWWCSALNLLHVRYRGFENLPPGGVVLAANHIALLDITCLLARIPEAVCIFKPSIRRNPVLGAAARRAGYLGSDRSHTVVRSAAAKVAAGHILVIFPEGTRRPAPDTILPFKPGFVLIARQAHAPIQLVRISTDSDVLTKQCAWWRLPRFPAHVEITLGPRLIPAANTPIGEIAAEIEHWFRQPPSRPVACAPAAAAQSST